jgi:hypothetical protein
MHNQLRKHDGVHGADIHVSGAQTWRKLGRHNQHKNKDLIKNTRLTENWSVTAIQFPTHHAANDAVIQTSLSSGKPWILELSRAAGPSPINLRVYLTSFFQCNTVQSFEGGQVQKGQRKGRVQVTDETLFHKYVTLATFSFHVYDYSMRTSCVHFVRLLLAHLSAFNSATE